MDMSCSINKVISIIVESIDILNKKYFKTVINDQDYSNKDIIMIKYSLNLMLSSLSYGTFADESTLICSLILLDRLLKSSEKSRCCNVNLDNIYYFIAGIMLIAIKMNQDTFRLGLFSTISGISKNDLFVIENQILSQIDYNCFISPSLYSTYKRSFDRLQI